MHGAVGHQGIPLPIFGKSVKIAQMVERRFVGPKVKSSNLFFHPGYPMDGTYGPQPIGLGSVGPPCGTQSILIQGLIGEFYILCVCTFGNPYVIPHRNGYSSSSYSRVVMTLSFQFKDRSLILLRSYFVVESKFD